MSHHVLWPGLEVTLYHVGNRRWIGTQRDGYVRYDLYEGDAPHPLRPEQAEVLDKLAEMASRAPRRRARPAHRKPDPARLERHGERVISEREPDKSTWQTAGRPPKRGGAAATFVVRFWYLSEGGEFLCADSGPLSEREADDLRHSLHAGQSDVLAARVLPATWWFDAESRRGRWVGAYPRDDDDGSAAVSVGGVPQLGPVTAEDVRYVNDKRKKFRYPARLVFLPEPRSARVEGEAAASPTACLEGAQ